MVKTNVRRAGSVNFTGAISPQTPQQPCTLSAELEGFPLGYLLGKDLGAFFSGGVETQEIPDSNFLTFDINSPEDAKLEVTVGQSVDSRMNMKGFKFLQSLAAILDDKYYELPEFEDQLSMVIKRQGTALEISKIQAEKRGRMLVRGNLKGAGNGQVEGVLRIGLPDTMIAASRSERLDNMFSEVRENYRWIDIEISGSSAAPQDNFVDQFKAASEGVSSATGSEPAISSPDTFDSLIEQK